MKNKYKTGFTLIELVIVVAIVAILAAMAYPSYKSSILKGKRAQARTALVELLQQQERYMTQKNCYLGFTNTSGTATAAADTRCNSTTSTAVPFKLFSGDNPSNPAYQLFADACPSGTSTMGYSECIRVNAKPTAPDPEVNVLSITSTGIKDCTGTAQTANFTLCWP
ncbi:type IV pilin protein [Rhodoferax sp.]|uniref:type IV pilin protein n=1 Tax=Rhodoferax sp. TaxID=50421 RepID=UPI0025E62401|nr:type IV pilin protein [Rhodoferax sp.]